MRQGSHVVFKPVTSSCAGEGEDLPRQRPTARSGDLIGEGQGGFTLLLRSAAADSLSALCRRRVPLETGGILGGFMGRDAIGPFAVVETIEEVESTSASAVHVSWTGAAINRARTRLAASADRLVACGWWHSHQNMDAFYSPEDKREQATWQDRRNLGIVVGRGGTKLAVFHGPDAAPVSLTRVRGEAPALSEFADKAISDQQPETPTTPAVTNPEVRETPSVPPTPTAIDDPSCAFNTVDDVLDLIETALRNQAALFERLRAMTKAERQAVLGTGGDRSKRGVDPILATRMTLGPRSSSFKRLTELRVVWRNLSVASAAAQSPGPPKPEA